MKTKSKSDTENLKQSARRDLDLLFNVRYVQRLNIPTGRFSELGKGFNPFGAGGGGFDPKAYKLLAKIFEFDYMGSAEYEYGQVPKAFAKIYDLAKEGSISKNRFELERKTVFYLSQIGFEKAVEQAIEKLAKNSLRTKGPTQLKEALQQKGLKAGDVAGWIDIENNFIFFIDEKMFEGTADLFKVK